MKRVVAALIIRQGRILICQRAEGQAMPLKWEFPGGKIEIGEEPRDALRRELDEELGIEAIIGDQVANLAHRYAEGGDVDLSFFLVHHWKGEIENRIFHSLRWVHPEELPHYDFLEADRKLIRDIAEGKLCW